MYVGRGTSQFTLVSLLKSLKAILKELHKNDFTHITVRAKRANEEFEEAHDRLDVERTDDEEREAVMKLTQKALFLIEAERQYFV